MDKTIFLIQSDKEYEEFLFNLLTTEGYKVVRGESEIYLINKLTEILPDLIISNYDLPNIDGASLYREVMKQMPDVKFIFLSAQQDIELISNMLIEKNCDFMVKPVVTAELLARIKAYLMPPEISNLETDTLSIKTLELSVSAKKVLINNEEIPLTPTEFKLLEYLMYNKNKVLSRDAILNKVWGTSDVSDRVVDVYIGYLREKLSTPIKESLIETVPGFGYVIRD